MQTRKERQKSGSIGGKARAKNLIANQANATFAKQISIGQFQKKLGLSRPQVVKILRQLVNSSLLVKKAGKGRTPNQWQINEAKFNDQLVNPSLLVNFCTSTSKPQLTTTGTSKDNIHTKDNKTKIKKEKGFEKKTPSRESGLKPKTRKKLWAALNKISTLEVAKQRGGNK